MLVLWEIVHGMPEIYERSMHMKEIELHFRLWMVTAVNKPIIRHDTSCLWSAICRQGNCNRTDEDQYITRVEEFR